MITKAFEIHGLHIALSIENANKLIVMVDTMFKRMARYTFFVMVYLSGILIGGVYTPEVIAYVKHPVEQKNVEQQDNQKPTHLKKKRQRTVSIG